MKKNANEIAHKTECEWPDSVSLLWHKIVHVEMLKTDEHKNTMNVTTQPHSHTHTHTHNKVLKCHSMTKRSQRNAGNFIQCLAAICCSENASFLFCYHF